MSFAHLLSTARFVQRDTFHRHRVVEVRHVRIVEGDMAVLANADKREVDGLRQQLSAVVVHHLIEI